MILAFLAALCFASATFAADCPESVPSGCTCNKAVLNCDNSDLVAILATVENVTMDRIEFTNCKPLVKHLTLLPAIGATDLKLSNCGIEKIDANAFENVAGLTMLNITKNNMTQIPLLNLPRLETIDLSYNQIFEFGKSSTYSNSLAALTNLIELDLRGNQLITIQNNDLGNLTKLEKLYLQSNKLEHLEPQAFAKLKNLQWIDLTNNINAPCNEQLFENQAGSNIDFVCQSLYPTSTAYIKGETLESSEFYGLEIS